MKLREIYPTVDAVRTKLREELNQATKEKRMFADFLSFMEYLFPSAKTGRYWTAKGADWQQVRYRAMLPPWKS